MSNSPGSSRKMDPTIIAALIGVVGTIIVTVSRFMETVFSLLNPRRSPP
jgi:hypothetical protein